VRFCQAVLRHSRALGVYSTGTCVPGTNRLRPALPQPTSESVDVFSGADMPDKASHALARTAEEVKKPVSKLFELLLY
jgi:hypothetical protein